MWHLLLIILFTKRRQKELLFWIGMCIMDKVPKNCFITAKMYYISLCIASTMENFSLIFNNLQVKIQGSGKELATTSTYVGICNKNLKDQHTNVKKPVGMSNIHMHLIKLLNLLLVNTSLIISWLVAGLIQLWEIRLAI